MFAYPVRPVPGAEQYGSYPAHTLVCVPSCSVKSRTLESIEFAAKDDAKLHSVFAHTRRVTGKTSLTVDTAIDADAKYGYFAGRPAPEHKNYVAPWTRVLQVAALYK